MKAFVLLAAVSAAQAAPQWVLPYAAHAVVTGNSVPVSVGGYKAVAGSNGDLAGPVHEVPGLVPALAVHKQESSGEVSLSTGTGAVVPTLAYHGLVYGKRSAEAEPKAEADPALLYSTGLVNPVTYTHAVPAVAAHTYAAVPAVQQVAAPVVNTVYNAVKVAQPVYSHVAQPLVYANPLVKVADHAVAATAAGYTHSANVGICTNNLGVQVPC